MKNTKPINAQNIYNTQYSGERELWLGEKYLAVYNKNLIKKLVKNQKNSKNILEFGAGIGTLAVLWEQVTGVKPECVELDYRQRSILEARGFCCYENIQAVGKLFDVIYTSNVLEHIEDDVLALQQIGSKLKAGGSLVVFVPAFQVLYSELDSRVGHYRRYQRKDLLKKLEDAGFVVRESCYFDSLGFFAWLYMKMKGRSSRDSDGNAMRFYDNFIFPISKALDFLGCKHLFGKNILVYAFKDRNKRFGNL